MEKKFEGEFMLTIDWLPNKKDQLPLYKQIFAYIKNKISTGQWPIHTKLPPQRELAIKLQVNRSTIRIALDELIAEGLLESKAGSGIWVANNTWSIITTEKKVNWNSYVSAGFYLPNLPFIQEINRLEFDESLIRLGTGELSPHLIPTSELNTILKSLPDKIDSFGYEEPKGLLYLRQQISKQLEKIGIFASPASIMIVSGALQALQLICFGLLPKDANILLEKPSYLMSLKLFQSMNLNFSELPLDSEGIQIEPFIYQQKHKEHSLLYTIPTFHNPTGTLMSEKRRHELLTACQTSRLPILEDDVYRDLWLDAPPPPPLKAIDTNGSVIYIDSLSKAISAGLRIGWIVGPEPVIEKLADIKMQNDYGSSCLSQWAAAEWFANGYHERHLQTLRQELILRRSAASEILNQNFKDIATWTLPQGGFYIWLHLIKPISMHQLFKNALVEKILINPGSIYDNLSNNHLRISYSYADIPDLKAGLTKLAHVIKRMNADD